MKRGAVKESVDLSPDLKAELLALTASVRGHLEAELELGVVDLNVREREKTRAPITSTVRRPRETAAAPSSLPAPARPPDQPEQSQSSTPAHSALLPPSERRVRLQLLADEASTCERCVLHEKRTQSVFARGDPDSEIVFVGEGPGCDEDVQGLPFVGPAGQLLDRMIAAMGYDREAVYVCNVVKCRPPENRTPRPDEAIACSHFLVPQLHAVSPKVIVALGRCAAQALGVAEATGGWRGRWGSWQGIPILPTYHPAFLLRSPEQKRIVWEDLQLVMARLGRSAPRRGG
jgi:uracil-DNA glycosylase family 4